MEFTTLMQIIDAILYFLIYGGSCFIILAVVLDVQTAWINHTSNTVNKICDTEESISIKMMEIAPASTSVEIAVTSIRNEVAAPAPVLVAKDSFAISKSSKSASKARIDELRQQCNNAKIQWRYARINPATGRKRHLTEQEMLFELG
ncbi:hypothetical protein CAL7716_100400 (plasmid) [Calothrix sp. PCC 7716]|nr:hypothetical protein CAL7716_100400 [Calothrix sp. PCC 7716]